jgi:hypothetical protein
MIVYILTRHYAEHNEFCGPFGAFGTLEGAWNYARQHLGGLSEGEFQVTEIIVDDLTESSS